MDHVTEQYRILRSGQVCCKLCLSPLIGKSAIGMYRQRVIRWYHTQEADELCREEQEHRKWTLLGRHRRGGW